MVTIVEVARHAGVAPSTVFYVLTGKRSISPETTTRVRDSIVELGYQLPAEGPETHQAPADVMALVLPLHGGMHLPGVTRLISAIAVAARRHDLDVLLVTADHGDAGLRRAAASSRVNGFLVLDAERAGERARVLRRLGRPSVLIGHPDAENCLPAVALDFEAAGARCLDHLADLGHRSIGFLGAPGIAGRTHAGFSAAAMRRGVVGTALPVEAGRESVSRTTSALLRSHPELTALVVHNEAALHGVIDSLRDQHRRVPQDVEVVAICPDGPLLPPLTSVELSAADLGARAVDLLVGLIGGAVPPALTLVPPRFVRRDSTVRSGGGQDDQ